MCLGTGLSEFREKFPNRFFDVGICEQHAVTFAAGLALAGLRPVVAVYSTFLERSFDQLVQDVCLQGLPVVVAVDRAGLVGEDGPTHHGVFDLSYLGMLPGMAVMAPMDEAELAAMLGFAVGHEAGPVAIRYPRGGSGAVQYSDSPAVEMGRARVMREGADGCVWAIGSMAVPTLKAAEALAAEGLELTVIDARFAKPLDRDLLGSMAAKHRRLVTVEENVLSGGFGSAVGQALEDLGSTVRLRRLGLPDRFVEQGPRSRLLSEQGLSADRLAGEFRRVFLRS